MRTSVLAARTILVVLGLCLVAAISYGLYGLDIARPHHVWFLVETRNVPLMTMAAVGVAVMCVGAPVAVLTLVAWLLDVSEWLDPPSNSSSNRRAEAAARDLAQVIEQGKVDSL